MYNFALTGEIIRGSTKRTWNCIYNFANLVWSKVIHLRIPTMPKSRRRHYSRSRSRSHSHDKERDPKRRKIEYDSPHKRSLSFEAEVNPEVSHGIGHDNEALEEVDEFGTILSSDEENMNRDISCGDSNLHTVKSLSSESSLIRKIDMNVKSTDDVSDKIKATHTPDSPDDTADMSSDVPQNNIAQMKSTCAVNDDTTLEILEKCETFVKDEIVVEHEPSEHTTVCLTLNDSKNDCNEEEIVSVSSSKENTFNIASVSEGLKNKQELKKEPECSEVSKEHTKDLEKCEQIRPKINKFEKNERRNKNKPGKLEQKRKESEQTKKGKDLKEYEKCEEKVEKEKKHKDKEDKEEQKREREQERLKRQRDLEEKNREKQKQIEQKQKAAVAFVNFFVSKKIDYDEKKGEENQKSLFRNFEVKSDMRLPPKRRNSLTDEEKNCLVEYILKPDMTCSYLKDMKDKNSFGKCGKTWPVEDFLDEVTIVKDDNYLCDTICEDREKVAKLRAKFLKFHENQRPPYFGTWRKKSKLIKPRRPFAKDVERFNYDEDSDDDWEEEEQGESLDDSDGDEKESEGNADDYEVDNEFFVPHGHLSDDEIEDEMPSKLSPELHEQKLRLLKEEFDEDIKSKTNKIKPHSVGCIWYGKQGRNLDKPLNLYLKPFSIITTGIVTLKKRGSKGHQRNTDSEIESHPTLIPELIKLVHGNISKRTALVSEFQNYMNKNGFDVNVSKANLGRKVKQIAQWMKCPEDGPMYNKFCWYVPLDTRRKYNVVLDLSNQKEPLDN